MFLSLTCEASNSLAHSRIRWCIGHVTIAQICLILKNHGMAYAFATVPVQSCLSLERFRWLSLSSEQIALMLYCAHGSSHH